MKIKHIMAALIAVFIFLPCAFTVFFSSYRYNKTASDLIRENIVTITDIRAENLRTYFSQHKSNLEIIARMPQLPRLLTEKKTPENESSLDVCYKTISNTLSARVSGQPYLKSIHCVDKYDTIIASSEPGATGTQFTYLQDIHEVENGKSMLSVVYAGKDDDAYPMIAIPLYYNDEFSGYLTAIISQKYFKSITDNTDYLDSGALTILDSNDNIIASDCFQSLHSLSGIKANGNLFNQWSLIDFEAAPSGTIDYKINGTNMHGYYVSMNDVGLKLLYSIDSDEISSKVFSTITTVIIAIFLMAAMAALLGIAVSKLFFSPVKGMLAAIHRLGEGDYNARFDSSGKNEFSTIAEAFNGLVDKLAKQTGDLKQINMDMRMTTQNIPGGFIRCSADSELEFTFISDNYLKLLNCTREEIESIYDNKFLNTVYEPDRMRIGLEIEQQLSGGNTVELEYRIQLKTGEILWVLDKSQRVKDENGTTSIYCVLVDITSQKRAQEKLKQNDERFRIILEQSDNIIFEWDFKSDSLNYSPQWAEKFGYHPDTENVLSMSIASNVHHDDEAEFTGWLHDIYKGKGASSIDVRFKTSKGSYLWLRIRSSIISDDSGNSVKAIFLITDIDSEKRQIERLTAQAQTDALTGLYNKGAGQMKINEYVKDPSSPPSALMIIDIDNFKEVNDTFGHLFGDATLKDIARALTECCPEQNIVSRIGGDEFIVLIKDVPSEEALTDCAEKILQKFHRVFTSDGIRRRISGSLGIALCPQHGEDFISLYKRADNALYYAKKQGKDRYAIYDNGMENSGYVKFFEQTQLNSQNHSAFKSSLVELVFNMLYETDNIDETIIQIFEIIGRHYNVSRVYLFENSSDNLSCSNTFEWCNDDIPSSINMLQNIPYESVSNHDRDFDNQGIYYCSNVDDCDIDLHNILAAEGIRSMLHCAVYDNGNFRGFVGFDDCTSTRYWTKDEIDILSFISKIVNVFFLKNQAQSSIDECVKISQEMEQKGILAYAVDKDTMKLKFVCRSINKLFPGVEPGEICYKAFGKETACAECPIAAGGAEIPLCKVYDSGILGKKVCSEFIKISINEKEDAYLITTTAIDADNEQ